MFTIFGKFFIISANELDIINNDMEDLRTKANDAYFKLMEKNQGGAKIQWDNWNNRQLEDLLKELEQVIETRKRRNQESCLKNLQLALKNTISAFSEDEDFKSALEEIQQKIDNRG